MFTKYHCHVNANGDPLVEAVTLVNFETGKIALKNGWECPIDQAVMLEASGCNASSGYRGLQDTQTTILHGDQLVISGVLYTVVLREDSFFLTGGRLGQEGGDMYSLLSSATYEKTPVDIIGNIYIAPVSEQREATYKTSFFAGLSESDKRLYLEE